jgi:hypothetical protein
MKLPLDVRVLGDGFIAGLISSRIVCHLNNEKDIEEDS